MADNNKFETAAGALTYLTDGVLDAPSKLYLRTTLHAALGSFGFEEAQIVEALDNLYNQRQGATLQ